MSRSPLEYSEPQRLDFGAFGLDLRSGEVWCDGAPVHLAALPTRLLRYLAANRSRTVSKAELKAELWPGLHVEEATLQQAVRAARKAVGDDGRRQDVIETVPGVGYRFVAVPVGESRERRSPAHSIYVGQRSVIEGLQRSLDVLSKGHPGLLLISGAPGTGKSRAVQELAYIASTRGFAVGRGGENAPEGAPAFWHWSQAFRALSAARPVEGLRERAPHLLGLTTDRANESAEPDRFRAREAALRCLEEAARLGPVVVVLEDIHRSGVAAAELIEFVLMRVVRVPLLLVATHREVELAARPELAAVVARLAELPGTNRIRIEPLSEIETAYLVEQRAGLEIPARDVSDVARHTGGIPFFAIELADHLHAERSSRETGRQTHAHWVERNAGKVLSDRLTRLDPAVRSVLAAASVCGTTFDPAVLARALKRQSVDEEIQLAMAERVITEPAAEDRQRSFPHALVRDALYAQLTARPRECQALHLRVAEAMESIRPDLEAEQVYHLCMAAPLAGAKRIADGTDRAVRRAVRAGDLETAQDLHERALAALEPLRSRAPIQYLRTLVAASELGVRGDPEARRLARRRLDEAITDLRAHGNPTLFARAVLARAYRTEIVGLTDERILALLDAALALLDGGQLALTARLRSRRAVEVRYSAAVAGEAEARSAVDRAIGEARRSGDAQSLARVLEDASLVRWSVPDPESWLRLNEEIVDAATRAGDTELVFQGVKGIATAHLEIGDRAGFEPAVDRCRGIANDYPSPFLKAVVACFDAARCFLDGDLAGAEQNAIVAASSGLDSISPMAAGQLYFHRREVGRLEELEGAMRQFIEDSPGIAMWPVALARALVDADRRDEARAALENVQPVEEIARDRNWLPTLIVLAESAVILEDRPLCARLFDALHPHARVNVVLGNGSLFLGSTAHYLGTLALALGRHEEAEELFDRAAEMHDRMDSEPWRLRTRAEQAHLARGQGDVASARALASRVASHARALGMIRCGERADSAVE